MRIRSIVWVAVLPCALTACSSFTDSDLAACRTQTEQTMATTRPCDQSAAGPVCEDTTRLRLTEQCMNGRGYKLDRERLAEAIRSDVRQAWRTAASDGSVWPRADKGGAAPK